MISEIQFPSLGKSQLFAYAKDLPFFKTHKKIVFKPGLNILFGPNGCGKSTILRMAALTLAAEQGGVSTITRAWLDVVLKGDFMEPERVGHRLNGIRVLHDGQPLLYGNPRTAVGVTAGGHFDDDFFAQGLFDRTSVASTGFTTMQRLNPMLAVAMKDAPFPVKVEAKLAKHAVNDVWKRRIEEGEKLLQASIPRGQSTLVMDEPESGLAIPMQGNLFDLLHKAATENDFQIIVATHSSFCLGLSGVNYIEMEKGYLGHTEQCLQIIGQRITELRTQAESSASAIKPRSRKKAVSRSPAEG